MSDLFIDFRESNKRRTSTALEFFKYYEDIQTRAFNYKDFSLVLARGDDWSVWGPYETPDKEVFVALAGRVAFENEEWEDAGKIIGEGGLACKKLYKMYKNGGLSALNNLNGAFVVFISDVGSGKSYIILDRCGVFPLFSADNPDKRYIFGSHADLLAKVLEYQCDLDKSSLAEFLITGKVMFPNSYYKNIKALESGCSYTIDMHSQNSQSMGKNRYFNFKFNIDHGMTKTELAEELKKAFEKAVRRRTNTRFGQSAISLSGGLDSRALLYASDRRDLLWAFCFYDDNNIELDVAREVARSAGAKFIPLKREFDYYGDSIEMGVKISGGTGNIFNNHYLGFRNTFKSIGIDNLISGFYCDRLFKGYVMNKKVSRILRTVKFSKFKFESNQRFVWPNKEYDEHVKDRLEAAFIREIRCDDSDLSLLKVEQKRIFPLYSESENPTVNIPLRVIGSFLPSVDNDIINVYLKTPARYKLYPTMYAQMVEMLCGKEASMIIDANTGTIVNPSKLSLVMNLYKRAIQRRIYKLRGTFATDGSWPNWVYYINNSKKIESLWMKDRNMSEDMFIEILGINPYIKSLREYARNDLDMFVRLVTLKIWMEQNT